MAQDDSPRSNKASASPEEAKEPRRAPMSSEYWLDIASTILLSVAALASSWAG